MRGERSKDNYIHRMQLHCSASEGKLHGYCNWPQSSITTSFKGVPLSDPYFSMTKRKSKLWTTLPEKMAARENKEHKRGEDAKATQGEEWRREDGQHLVFHLAQTSANLDVIAIGWHFMALVW